MVKIQTNLWNNHLAFSLGSPSHRMTMFWSPEVGVFIHVWKKADGISRISRVFFFAVKNQQQVHVWYFHSKFQS